jgi:hypothetical protein
MYSAYRGLKLCRPTVVAFGPTPLATPSRVSIDEHRSPCWRPFRQFRNWQCWLYRHTWDIYCKQCYCMWSNGQGGRFVHRTMIIKGRPRHTYSTALTPTPIGKYRTLPPSVCSGGKHHILASLHIRPWNTRPAL